MLKYTYKDRRDPDYIPPVHTNEELEDMYEDHLEEEREERKIDTLIERELRSTEEVF